jgi:tetrachlorobenzoquinone reductase
MKTQNLTVKARRQVAVGIDEWTLVDGAGNALPGFTAGAHVDLFLAPGLARSYSLVQPSSGQPTDRYVVAVALAPHSRGGSAFVHERLGVGDVVAVGQPRNLFPLADDHAPVLFIAGGIGITPLLSMASERRQQGRAWSMVYAARSRSAAAYLNELNALGGELTTHFDDEHDGRPVDLLACLSGLDPAAHVYCCGPKPLMDKVRELALQLGHPESQLHFESFGGVSTADASSGSTAFTVKLSRQGLSVTVEPDQSILDALEAQGVIVPSVCREGHCGSCECVVVEGEVDHRDQILSTQERDAGRSMMICVSRAKGEGLVLDL